MDRWASKFRSVSYPMVGVILIGSLWALASEKAQSDRIDDQYSRPLPPLENHSVAASGPSAPAAVENCDAQ